MEQSFEGIHLDLTGHRELQFDYRQSDVEVVYRRTQPSSWDDMIGWLETKGTNDNELTPGEVVAMVEDLRTLKNQGARFTSDPAQAYQEAHRHRAENMRKHGELHRKIQEASERIRKTQD